MYTGVDLQVIHFYLNSYTTPACKVTCTEIVTQELLHRRSANFQVIKLYLNACKIRLLQFFYLAYPLQRVGHPVWRNAGLVCPWATLCGDRACRMGKHVVCFERPSMWWNVNFFRARATLWRDRAGRTSKHVVKCNLVRPRAASTHELRVNRQKRVKLWFWQFRCKRGMKVTQQ